MDFRGRQQVGTYPLDISCSGEWEPRFSIMKDIPKDSKAATQQHFSYDIYGDSAVNK